MNNINSSDWGRLGSLIPSAKATILDLRSARPTFASETRKFSDPGKSYGKQIELYGQFCRTNPIMNLYVAFIMKQLVKMETSPRHIVHHLAIIFNENRLPGATELFDVRRRVKISHVYQGKPMTSTVQGLFMFTPDTWNDMNKLAAKDSWIQDFHSDPYFTTAIHDLAGVTRLPIGTFDDGTQDALTHLAPMIVLTHLQYAAMFKLLTVRPMKAEIRPTLSPLAKSRFAEAVAASEGLFTADPWYAIQCTLSALHINGLYWFNSTRAISHPSRMVTDCDVMDKLLSDDAMVDFIQTRII